MKIKTFIIIGILITVIFVGFIACGGGGGGDDVGSESGNGSNGNNPPVSHVSPNGIWQGAFKENGVGAFDISALMYNGRMMAVSETGYALLDGNYTVDGNKFTANVTAYQPNGEPFLNANITGTFVEQSSISASFVTSRGTNGVMILTFNEIYNHPSSLSMITGTWSWRNSNQALILTINNDGTFSGESSDDCKFSGHITVQDPTHNFYKVDMTLNSCDDSDGSYSGFGVLDISFVGSFTLAVSNGTRMWAYTFTHPYKP